MKTLSAPAIAALSAPVLSIAQLVYIQFPGIPVALTSWHRNLTFGGVTYLGAAGLGTIGQVDDSPGEVKGLQFGLSGVPIEYVALALSDATVVQGAAITLRLGILGAAGEVVDAPIDWAGRIDTMSIEETGDTCTIAVAAESTQVDLLRGTPLTYSNADQKSLYPDDRAFEFIESQFGKPIIWAGKQWLIALQGVGR